MSRNDAQSVLIVKMPFFCNPKEEKIISNRTPPPIVTRFVSHNLKPHSRVLFRVKYAKHPHATLRRKNQVDYSKISKKLPEEEKKKNTQSTAGIGDNVPKRKVHVFSGSPKICRRMV